MSEFPISCVLCRRKKIKCNKHKPCNQCVKKGTRCEFPEKFRNISISMEEEERSKSGPLESSNSGTNSNYRSGGSDSPLNLGKLSEEIELLRKEKLSVLHENFKLSQQNHQLKDKLQAVSRSSNVEALPEGGIEISGETTELGRKYYGPQLSTYMIEALRQENDKDGEKKNEGSSGFQGKQSLRINSDELNQDGEVALMKKLLPWVVDDFAPSEHNKAVLQHLVGLFFRIHSYECFVSQVKMGDFINLHHAIKDAEWENDDDMLLLHIMLILVLQRMTPLEYNESRLLDKPVQLVSELHKRMSTLIKNTLYKGFTRLRHNLLNESIVTVQAYILCTEWYFIDQRYEEAWLMMFHCTAVAYSIGLHVMAGMRTTNDYPEEAPIKLAEMVNKEDGKEADDKIQTRQEQNDEEDDENYDVLRIKVWFALKNLGGQLCLVLGRPNPILIQVNSVVLFTSTSESVNKMELDKKSTQVQLKMGLSECLRLSNMMLIESFMMNFSMEDVVGLDNRFKKEAEELAWFVSPEYQQQFGGKAGGINEWSHVPRRVDRNNAVGDLIILYINRAKLLEPFINQFLEETESRYLFSSICESVELFLDYVCEFILRFLTEETPKFLNPQGKVGLKLRLGKAFRTKYPFINSFIYQGVIVIFTLLNYKAKEFVVGGHNQFLELVSNKLNAMMQFDLKVSAVIGQGVHLWSTNIVYLINKDIQHVNMLLCKADEYANHASENREAMNADFERVLADAFDFNIKDPFWFTNPENIPYYLSSPSEDGTGMLYDQGSNLDGSQTQPGNDYSQPNAYERDNFNHFVPWNRQPFDYQNGEMMPGMNNLDMPNSQNNQAQNKQSVQNNLQNQMQNNVQDQMQNHIQNNIQNNQMQGNIQSNQMQNNQMTQMNSQIPNQPISNSQMNSMPNQNYMMMQPQLQSMLQQQSFYSNFKMQPLIGDEMETDQMKELALELDYAKSGTVPQGNYVQPGIHGPK